GTRARVELPVELSAAPALAPSGEGQGGGPAILVVEDTDVARELLVQQLARLGRSAVAVANGAEALRAAAQRAFALVLLDRSLPDQAGEEVALALVAQAARLGQPRPRIVAVTAALPEVDDGLATQAFDDVRAKPLSLDELSDALRASEPATARVEVDHDVVRDLLAAGAAGQASMLARYLRRVDDELPAHLARVAARV